jgi:hypothetical protein
MQAKRLRLPLITDLPRALQPALQFIRHVDHETEDRRRRRVAVVVEAQAARDAAAQCAFGDKVERAQAIDFVTGHLARYRTGIEVPEALRGELVLQLRIKLGLVCDRINGARLALKICDPGPYNPRRLFAPSVGARKAGGRFH